MHKPSFWAAFEEASDELSSESAMKTQTRAREEPDQRASGLGASTKTLTATREEPDQRFAQGICCTIPRSRATLTQTITETREERDQDTPRGSLAAIPQLSLLQTSTMTKVEREEPDQDESLHHLVAIPRWRDVDV